MIVKIKHESNHSETCWRRAQGWGGPRDSRSLRTEKACHAERPTGRAAGWAGLLAVAGWNEQHTRTRFPESLRASGSPLLLGCSLSFRRRPAQHISLGIQEDRPRTRCNCSLLLERHKLAIRHRVKGSRATAQGRIYHRVYSRPPPWLLRVRDRRPPLLATLGKQGRNATTECAYCSVET